MLSGRDRAALDGCGHEGAAGEVAGAADHTAGALVDGGHGVGAEKGCRSAGDGDMVGEVKQSRAAWARLLAKIYDVDVTGGSGAQPRGSPLKCSRCGSPMKVLAVITDPIQVRRVLLHLIKTGAAPPGPDASALN